MSTHTDPGSLVKLNWPDTGFGALADFVKNAITTREPPLEPATSIAKEVYKRNLELVNENTLVELRANSLEFLIEKNRDTIANQEALISEYKDRLAESEAKRRILEAKFIDTTGCAQKPSEDPRVLSGDFYDAGTQINFFKSELALEVSARNSIATFDTVTRELEATTRATLGLGISQLEAQLANIRERQSYQQSRTINRIESATFEERMALLANDFESKNRNPRASDDEVVALKTQLAEQDDEFGTAHDVVDDLDDLLDIKNNYIQEIQAQHADEVAKLNAYILMLEKQLEASRAAPPITATPFHFDGTETPRCNLPRPVSHFERPSHEPSDIGDGAEQSKNPESFATQEYFRVYTRRGRDPVVIRPPHSDTNWRVKNGKTLGSERRPPLMDFGVANSTSSQPEVARSEAPTTSWRSTRLSATAVAFVPRSATSVGPFQRLAGYSQLRPTAALFQPSRNAARAPNVSSRLAPMAPAFVPRGMPTLGAPRLRVTAPPFVPPQPTTTNISLRPTAIAFVPRRSKMSGLQLRGDAAPFVPGRGPSAVPLRAVKTAPA